MSSSGYNYNRLAGKHVLVIGATSGIGFAVTKLSLAASAKVTISSSSSDRIATTIQNLISEFPLAQLQGHACDLSKDTVEAEIESLF